MPRFANLRDGELMKISRHDADRAFGVFVYLACIAAILSVIMIIPANGGGCHDASEVMIDAVR